MPLQQHSPSVVGTTGVISLLVGGYRCLALTADGSVWACGADFYGRWGSMLGGDCGGAPCTTAPVRAGNLSGTAAVAGRATHSLALPGSYALPSYSCDSLYCVTG